MVLPIWPDPHAPLPTLLPAVYGDYRAERYVARGGMGLVLNGRRDGGIELVAIKVLLPGMLTDRRQAEFFEREVAKLARVRHPNVVELLDHGKSGRFHFLVLEWIEGPSLRQVIADANRAGRLTDYASAFRWFGQVAKGMAAIHAVGMVHRDIKPSNILIGLDGVARVADLGIARRVDAAHTSYTTTGHVSGTFEYMAPEQLAAPDTVDGRTDLYSLGVTFFESLTGTRPVGAWRPVSEVNPTVPQGFDAILGRSLAPRPEHRFGDIYELIAALTIPGPGPDFSPRPIPKPGGGPGPAAPGPSRPGPVRAAWDSVAGMIGAIGDRYSGSEELANVAARNGAIWGAVLLGTFGAVVGIPIGLIAAILARDPQPLAAFVPAAVLLGLIGIVGGGIVGAIWGASTGAAGRGPGSVQPVSIVTVVARIFGPPLRRIRALWGRPPVQLTGGQSVAGIGGGASPPIDRQPTTGWTPGPTTPGSGGSCWELIPARGDRAPWRLTLSESAIQLVDPQGFAVANLTKASAEGAFVFPCFWYNRRHLRVRGEDGKVRPFRADRRTIRAIRDYLDFALEESGPEASRAVKRRGYRRLIAGIVMLVVGAGLTAWGEAAAEARPEGGEYLVFGGLILYGGVEVARGFGTFLRVDGIQQRTRARLGGVGTPGSMPAPGDAAAPERDDPDAGPWSPGMIGWGMLLFGPLWAGLVAALNWRRLDHTARYRLPIILGVLGSIGLLLLPVWEGSTWLILAGDLAIGLFALAPQQKIYRTYRKAGGRKGKIWLPLLLILIGEIPIGWSIFGGRFDHGEPYIEQAVTAIRHRDADRAIAACEAALAGNLRTARSRASALSMRGVAYGLKRDFTRAISDCDAAIKLDPTLAVAYANRGRVCTEKKEFEMTLSDCGRAIALEPNLAVAYLNRAFAFALLGTPDSALADADRAIGLDPDLAEAYVARGLARFLKGLSDPAIADADEAIRRDPSSAEAYCLRSMARVGKQDLIPAIADADRSISLSPNLSDGWLVRGIAYQQKGEFDRAISDLTRALELDPSLAVARNARGLAFLGKGERDRAVADFDEAIRLDPKLSITHSNRSLVYLGKGEHDRALADCDRVIKLDPGNAEAFLWRGSAYNAKREYDRAIPAFSEAIRLDPTLALAYNSRGVAYYQKGEHDRAIRDYDEAVRHNPNDPEVFANRGLAHQVKGDLDAAVADFQSAIRLNPPDAQQYQELLRAAESSKQQSSGESPDRNKKGSARPRP